MRISIKPELQQFIEKEVSEGHFSSPDEVIEAALARLMMSPVEEVDDEPLAPERVAAIRKSIEQLDQGEGIPFEAAAAELKCKSS